jgi:hypothetical protein
MDVFLALVRLTQAKCSKKQYDVANHNLGGGGQVKQNMF